MYLITFRASSRQKFRILRSGQMDPQANLKINPFLRMVKSYYLISLISNLLGITQLPVTERDCGWHWGCIETASNRCVGYNADTIIKNSDSLFDAVSHKSKIHLVAITEKYLRVTFLDLQMEMFWEDVHALPERLHIHCVKEGLPGKIKTSQFKNDECSIIHLLKHFSNVNAIPVQENLVKEFAIGQYVIVKCGNFFYPGEVL